MKTDEMIITGSGEGMDKAVSETEQLGFTSGLNPKQCLHLRLLAEELVGMMQSVAGKGEARFTAEQRENTYTLELSAHVDMTKEMRKNLIDISSKGENAAIKGFMGRLKDSIAAAFLPSENGPSGMTVGLMGLGSPSGYANDDSYSWTMSQYVNGVKKSQSEEAKEAWDELEKSIVASIANEVTVYIKDSQVRIIITKVF